MTDLHMNSSNRNTSNDSGDVTITAGKGRLSVGAKAQPDAVGGGVSGKPGDG